MFSENTSEIDFTMLERSGSESTGYFLAIAAARCPNVWTKTYGLTYPIFLRNCLIFHSCPHWKLAENIAVYLYRH